MAQAKIYWDMDQYAQVEKIFRKSVEFCSESDIWKLNVAHVLFMQVPKKTLFWTFWNKVPVFLRHPVWYVIMIWLLGEQVQRSHRFLWAYRKEELWLHPECVCNCVGKPLRELHHDLSEWGGGGTHEEDREGGGAACLRGPGQKGVPPLHREPGDWDPVLRQG